MNVLTVMFYRPKTWRTKMRRCAYGVHGLIQKKFGDDFSRLCSVLKVSFAFLGPGDVTEKSIKEKAPVLILLQVSGSDGMDIEVHTATNMLIYLEKAGLEIKSYGFGQVPEYDDSLMVQAIRHAVPRDLN